MPERKSVQREEQKSATALRRSPRFSNTDPRIPQPAAEKIRAVHFVATPAKSHKKRGEVSSIGEEKIDGSRIRVKSSKGFKKLAKTDIDLEKQCVIEKRVTRSSVRGYKCVNYQESDCGERVNVSSKEVKARVNVKPFEQCVSNIEKRVTRSSSRTSRKQQAAEGNGVVSEEATIRGDVETGMSEKDEKERGFKKGVGAKDCERKLLVGEKMKRNAVEKESESLRGWNKEQESALERAYFTAKPTPHFWKKVAKMVPGKSAEECFERINCDHLTPPQPHTRSRTRAKSSSLSFSASKLLSPANTKSKRLKSGKRNCLVAQKTVRKLLLKQLNEDQGHAPDLFGVLEPTIDPSSLNFGEGTVYSSPTPNLASSISTVCRDGSSSGHKKHLSRLNNSNKADPLSPPVLKPIRNKALHEKYIDQLHNRNAKKKAESLRIAKYRHGKNEKKASHFEVDSVKVAKDALMFEAEDLINQFRSMQSSIVDNISDTDNDTDSSDGDEDEF